MLVFWHQDFICILNRSKLISFKTTKNYFFVFGPWSVWWLDFILLWKVNIAIYDIYTKNQMRSFFQLLVCLVALFLFCWLPLSLFHIFQATIRWCWSILVKKNFGNSFGALLIFSPRTKKTYIRKQVLLKYVSIP